MIPPDPNTQNAGQNGSGADQLSSLNAGASSPFDAVEQASDGKIPSGVAVLVLVALVGGGAIFAMRQSGLGAGYRYDDITIDYPIDAKQVSDESDDYKTIVSDLTDHDVPHVPISDLRPSPFKLRSGPEADEREFEAVAQETPEERRARQRAERAAVVQREFSKLELNSVIGGSSPIARVSGQPVRVGDSISGIFTVAQIAGRHVVLEAEGRQYTLTMAK